MSFNEFYKQVNITFSIFITCEIRAKKRQFFDVIFFIKTYKQRPDKNGRTGPCGPGAGLDIILLNQEDRAHGN